MTTRKQQTIRARIAEEAIAKVMQFFDGTLAQALHEILQNARRSGATSVAITHDRADGRITVSDDGRGIGDPTALLAFGRSGWPKDLHGAEHPAGMGIFSLARRSPRIRSRVAGPAAWGVQLGEDHFVGRAPAAVAADPGWDRDHGTEVAFSVLPTDSCWTPGVIADAVRHYPIPVTVNGRKAEQSDFLEDAARTEIWRGLRVGVFHSTSPTWATPGINFHGLHVAFSDLPQVHALPGADADAPRTWWTLADVADCPDLELTLPTRTAIVQTPFTAELVSEATRIIYRAIAAAGRAPRLGHETRTRAAAAGIALPADPRHLTPWRPNSARDAKPLERPRHPDLQHAILVDDDELDAAESQTLAWAARESGTLGRYWEIESGLRGYRWYDELPCIIGVNVQMRRGTQTHTSTRKTRRAGEHPFRGAVDEIELELLVKREGQDAPGEMRVPASAALLSPEGGGTSEIEPIFVARRDAPIDRNALCSALTEAYFQPSFDNDADSIDTQMREYRRRIAYIVTELLESREAAADADLRDLVTTCILPSIGGDSNVDIEIRNGALHGAPPDLTKRILTGHEQPRRSIEPLRRAFCLATEPTTMRIEIHRWRMVGGPHDDGRVDVAYNVLVPLEDCVPNNSSNIQVLLDRSVYRDYPDATWSTDLAPGWERYEAWLAHECAAKRRMLEFLHQHCPETRALDEWPTLWASIPPELAEDLHTIHFTIPPPGDPNHDHQQHPAPPPADAAA